MVTKKRVVVLGAGVAGLYVAQDLAKDSALDVTLVSDREYFTFLPRLTELLAGTQPAKAVVLALKDVWKGTLHIDAAGLVNPTEKQVMLKSGTALGYDVLVVAIGSQTNYFNTPGSQYAYPFYQKEDMEHLKEHVERMLEADEQPGTHTFAIVGGGPTGVEVSYALAQVARKARPASKILLLEAGPAVLKVLPANLAQAATKALQDANIEIHTNTAVKNITPMSIDVERKESGKETIPCFTTIWAAGSKPQQIAITGVEFSPRGEIPVKPTMQTLTDSSIFAVGDIAAANCPKTAQAALQQAQVVAANVRKFVQEKTLTPFSYKEKGTIIALEKETVGLFWGNLVKGFMAKQVRDKYYRFQLRNYE